jgi:putative aldouronate transport system substrate-binding protein
MKISKQVKSITVLLLVAVFILSMTGFRSYTKKAIDKTPITLKVCIESPTEGIGNDVVTKKVLADTGVTLDIIIATPDRLKILAASGDLPDIIEMHESAALASNLIQSNSVIPLDDLLNKYGADIKKKTPTALKWSKDILGNGKTYFLPSQVQTADLKNPNGQAFVGFFTRWDLYKAIGTPKISNEDDYLTVLKKMVQKNPTTKDGKKVYALSGWNDWGLWPYNISYPFTHGFTNLDNDGLLNRVTGEVENMYLKTNGVWWQGINFFNKAYRLGIFDPEAFIMKASQYSAKIKDGEVLVSADNWEKPDTSVVGKNAVMEVLPGAFPYISGVYPEENKLGYLANNALAISTNCKYPERAMQLINYFNTDEGSRLVVDGVKGIDWDVVKGKPALIGKRLNNILTGNKEDKDYADTKSPEGISKLIGFVLSFKTNPLADGYPLDLSTTAELKIKGALPEDKDFSQFYGGANAVFPGQAYDKMIKNGLAKTVTALPLASKLEALVSDESKRIFAQADEYMASNIARIIMAKSPAQFLIEKNKAISDIKAMGYMKAYNETLKLLEDAKKIEKNFK